MQLRNVLERKPDILKMTAKLRPLDCRDSDGDRMGAERGRGDNWDGRGQGVWSAGKLDRN